VDACAEIVAPHERSDMRGKSTRMSLSLMRAYENLPLPLAATTRSGARAAGRGPGWARRGRALSG